MGICGHGGSTSVFARSAGRSARGRKAVRGGQPGASLDTTGRPPQASYFSRSVRPEGHTTAPILSFAYPYSWVIAPCPPCIAAIISS